MDLFWFTVSKGGFTMAGRHGSRQMGQEAKRPSFPTETPSAKGAGLEILQVHPNEALPPARPLKPI